MFKTWTHWLGGDSGFSFTRLGGAHEWVLFGTCLSRRGSHLQQHGSFPKSADASEADDLPSRCYRGGNGNCESIPILPKATFSCEIGVNVRPFSLRLPLFVWGFHVSLHRSSWCYFKSCFLCLHACIFACSLRVCFVFLPVFFHVWFLRVLSSSICFTCWLFKKNFLSCFFHWTLCC